MAFVHNLLLLSIPLVLLSLFFQAGTPALVLDLFFGHVAAVRSLLATTYCYQSVITLSENQGHAECFRVFKGKFTKIISKASVPPPQARPGHVIPGLWDGHGHLVQFGESLDSVVIFGAGSMQEVHKRLREYKTARPEAGTRKQWLRGVGWDQANFGGKWPTSVCPTTSILPTMNPGLSTADLSVSRTWKLMKASKTCTSCWIAWMCTAFGYPKRFWSCYHRHYLTSLAVRLRPRVSSVITQWT